MDDLKKRPMPVPLECKLCGVQIGWMQETNGGGDDYYCVNCPKRAPEPTNG